MALNAIPGERPGPRTDMGNTYRTIPSSYFRSPRGRIQALRRGDRAVPPDPWEDIRFNGEVYLPWRVARRLLEEGRGPEEVVAILRRRFRVPGWKAREIVGVWQARARRKALVSSENW